MKLNILDYYEADEWNRIRTEADCHSSPFLVVDLGIIRNKYLETKEHFSFAKIYYAIKANPAPEIIMMLRDLGSCFDVASIYELDEVLALGVEPERLSYGNTIKKASDIRYFYERGVRLFATDSESDIRNIAQEAPGSKVMVRFLTDGSETADWPLSRKFGCHSDMVISLITLAARLGLDPCGLSFHVGSQQRDIGAWDSAISSASHIFSRMEEEGIKLRLINMGGGFPAKYKSPTNPIEIYASEITRYLNAKFANDLPEIIIEPGRSLVGDAGVLVSEVINVTQKSHFDIDKWVFVDVGTYGGLVETNGESIKYPLYCEATGEPSKEFIVAGPTCDSADIMYEYYRNPLPENIAAGDRIYWLTTGAYTGSCCAVEFNGFPPLKTFFVQ